MDLKTFTSENEATSSGEVVYEQQLRQDLAGPGMPGLISKFYSVYYEWEWGDKLRKGGIPAMATAGLGWSRDARID